ncbi:hypothetical protein [Mongoliitalea lutea]|uniref:Uncharacterized protein n=1 Tax=Mongoliitalea lutea TaxID=849756 RepID=A0A8J3G731_9BACT|nr:hypothetical protein [Mongoliitalea lutea]GHB49047.1 hypothetical protein GCM10008106_32270 [Mongoliitalea lutea]
MRYLYTIYHPQNRYSFQLPLEETENSIHTSYFIADEEAYERVKAGETPLSQLSWFVEKDFDDQEEEEMYRYMTDDEYFMNQVTSKVTGIIQEIYSNWFKLIKSSKKRIEVCLFATSSLYQGNQLDTESCRKDYLQIFIPPLLIEKKLNAAHHRIHIPTKLSFWPTFDLLYKLDFLMADWRYLLSNEFPHKSSDLWLKALWSLRNQSLTYLPLLRSAEGLELDPRKIRAYLTTSMQRILAAGENGDLNWRFVRSMHSKLVRRASTFGSALMLHALQVYEQFHPNKELKEALRAVCGINIFFDQKDIETVYRFGRKMDFDKFLFYLTVPTDSEPAMIDGEIFRKVNRMLLALEKSTSLYAAMLEDTSEHLFHLSLEGKKRKDSYLSLDGVRLHLHDSAFAKLQLICEEWT